jgi:hypothetical protein
MLIGGTIATVTSYIISWINKRLNKNKEGKNFILNTSIRAKINEVLIEIRAHVRANRVNIIEYHNGNVSTNGLPFNFSSMTYESVDYTTKEQILEFQKIPISPISKFLIDIHNHTEKYIKVGTDFSDQEIIRLNKFHGINTNYTFKIGNHIKDGVINISWVFEDVTLTEEEIEFISIKTIYIHELMSKMIQH